MNIRATATFKAGSFAAIEAKLVPRIMKAVEGGTQAVFDISQELVAVRTETLKDSGRKEVTWIGYQVKGAVLYTAGYAAYVEMGTGRRGASSAGAGPFPYNMDWPGMVAIPYLRPALDTGRPQIIRSFADQGFTV